MTDQTTVDTTAPAEAQPVQLQLADILATAQIIQLASSRGAFRAEEFTQVGGVYERVVGFLQASGALAPAQTDATAPADTSAQAPADAQAPAPAADATAPATN
jgi:hypothetical protein